MGGPWAEKRPVCRRLVQNFVLGVIFFFNDTATTEIYTLSLHDALPIWRSKPESQTQPKNSGRTFAVTLCLDRKSTRLNSSHSQISYAVFCLKKKTGSLTSPILTRFCTIPCALSSVLPI